MQGTSVHIVCLHICMLVSMRRIDNGMSVSISPACICEAPRFRKCVTKMTLYKIMLTHWYVGVYEAHRKQHVSVLSKDPTYIRGNSLSKMFDENDSVG